ncbi:hypothetical protein D3C78_1961950 [compost metagenome]
MQQQLAIVADVVAVDCQGIVRSATTRGHVDDPGIVQGDPLTGGVGANRALDDGQGAAAIDGKNPG